MRSLASFTALGLTTVALVSVSAGCQRSSQARAQTPPAAPTTYAPPTGYYPQQPYPQQPYPQQPYPQQPYPQQGPGAQPPPQPPAPQVATRPLLTPLVGMSAQQQEVRMILTELVAALPSGNQQKVAGIPLSFDPTTEVNAYAGCDEQGKPFMAATAGILEAVDAIAQTRATDELFGTQTYEAYSNAVIPQVARDGRARAALPLGIIPQNLGPDLRRWSRAREIFQEVMAFTMGHELAHHYLGHTGCANGQPMGNTPDPAMLGRLLTRVPTFNQVAEAAADSAGAYDALDAGRARRPQYAWTENGGVFLLDFFARIERAGGGGGLGSLLSPVSFLRTHPNPLARIPLLQTVARTWRAQRGG